MKNVAKVAVSIPVDTLEKLERAVARLHKTRSAVVTAAIQHWLRAEEVGVDDQRYVEGYLRRPEQSGGMAEVASAVVETWEPWE
jgi:metal-responsive CopG/Arc/MetJ family transcriptional regulator